MNKLLSICFVLLLGVNQIVAQDIQVNGTVLGIDNQEPVIGATILVVGSHTGTVTDMDGKFSLKVPADATLQVSFIGMRMEKVKAKPEMIIFVYRKAAGFAGHFCYADDGSQSAWSQYEQCEWDSRLEHLHPHPWYWFYFRFQRAFVCIGWCPGTVGKYESQ